MINKDKSCIFCKIINGEEKSNKVYEDEDILAFMDIRPINPGELLIIPKDHIDHFFDVSDEVASKMMRIAQRLARKIYEKFNPLRIGYVVHGFGVSHAHLAIVPLKNRDDIISARFMRIDNNNIVIDLELVPKQKYEELDRIANMLQEK